MKKLFLFGLLMIMSVCCIFGQIDSKKLFLATNSFVTEESDDWKIYDGKFTVMDTINEEYTFDGGFVVKILVGSSRYDFTCTVKNEGDDFIETLISVCGMKFLVEGSDFKCGYKGLLNMEELEKISQEKNFQLCKQDYVFFEDEKAA